MSKSFKGRLAGVDYDQPGLFKQAAKALGFGVARRSWKPGAPVTIQTLGGRVSGQVWSKAEGSDVWVALEDQRFALVSTRTRSASVLDRQGGRDYLSQVA